MAEQDHKPVVNLAELRSVEEYVESSGKFRTKCAAFQIPGRDAGSANTLYIPYCNKQRFDFGPILSEWRGHGLFVPPEMGKRWTMMDFIPFREHFHDIRCPQGCRGYRNRRVVGIVDRLKSLLTLKKGRKWTPQEKVGIIAVPVVLALLTILIAFFTPELRRALHLDKASSEGTTTSNAPGGIVNNGGVINNPTINNGVLASKNAYELTDEQRTLFLKQASDQTAPRDTLRIGCTSWSESSCVAAGRFLFVLSEAGWQIEGNKVFRLEPQIPIVGVAIATRTPVGESKEPLPPHEGRWRRMDESHKTIYWAFNSLHIPVSSSTDDSLKDGTLGVYFGPEPK